MYQGVHQGHSVRQATIAGASRVPDCAEAAALAHGGADGPPPSPLAACAGALGVLAAAGDKQPLVVLVDDLQWIDPESQQLMLFVARRLATEHVVILFAAREMPGAQYQVGDLPAIRL